MLNMLQYLELANKNKHIKEYDKFAIENIKKVKHKIFKCRDAIIYIVSVISSDNKSTYDVILDIPNAVNCKDDTIEKLEFSVFSASPSFTYKTKNAFIENDMYCEWVMKNTYPLKENCDIVDKTVYVAIKYLNTNGYLKPQIAVGSAINVSNRTSIKKHISTTPRRVENVGETNIKEVQKTSTKPTSTKTKSINRTQADSKKSSTTKKTKKVSTTAKTKSVKYIKSI